MNLRKRLSVLFLLGVAVAPSIAAAGGHQFRPPHKPGPHDGYVFSTIDPPGATSSMANGLSTHAIVGEYTTQDGATHGYIVKNGAYTTYDVPGAVYSSINGINENGSFVGTYAAIPSGGSTAIGHAYVVIKGTLTTLDPPDSSESQGGFINSRGEVVGGYRDHVKQPPPSNAYIRHAFHWYRGKFTTIDPPNRHPSLGPIAWGINDEGDIVGTYVDTDGKRHGFLLSRGVYTTLDVPGATLTIAEGINNVGEIVGEYDVDTERHGFVLKHGVYTTVDVPDASATAAFSVNAQGQIAGLYDDAAGVTHGFLATPGR